MAPTILGAVLGPLGGRTAGVADGGYDNSAGDYTFAIGGLPFNVAPTDEHPYQRATAQFRKEQQDAEVTVGDQSLDGYWTRGQLSFHRGAGIKYYEVLDGQAVINRFNDSSNVTPWVPGALSLPKELVNKYATNSIDGAVRYSTADLSHFIYVINNSGVVVRVRGSTQTVLTSAAATSISASDNPATYITSTNKVQSLTTGTTFADLITNGSASLNTFVKVEWAKGRLFMCDAAGRWFAKPDAVATVVEADAFWASGIASAVGEWSVAETPSVVYMGRGNSIYSVAPGTNGAVPTLTAPVVAATLPSGETLQAMAYSIGQLVIVTSNGVRVAAVTETGTLTYGPLVIPFSATTCRKVGTWGNLAYVTGVKDGEVDTSVWELDLANVVNNLVPYDRRCGLPGGHTGSGALRLAEGLATFGIAGVAIESTTTLEPTGYVTTGFHRFGTLEPKAFHSIRPRIEGTGSVTVSRIDQLGNEYQLVSLAPSSFSGEDISLGLSAPLETLAIKFTLARDAGTLTGPTVLGYQLKAQPAPTRSRMISVPLLCFDIEDGAYGIPTGYTGAALDRLKALEDMERTAGEVVWQDFRTGESGLAFIEQIAFSNRTPPSASSNGFGGLVTVTLRILS